MDRPDRLGLAVGLSPLKEDISQAAYSAQFRPLSTSLYEKHKVIKDLV